MARPPEASVTADSGPETTAAPLLGDDRVSILLVDDRPDKLLALEAILGDLGQNMVRAYSGARPSAPSCSRTSRSSCST
jgi:response regulator RpfG family c-di-GMP phosphodiesterase